MTTRIAMIALAALLAAAAARAEPKLDVSVSASREETRVEEGRTVTRRVPVEVAHPGDVILYAISYKNVGGDPVAQAAVTDPIPEGVAYVAGSATASPVAPLFSIDGGKSFGAEPLKYVVRDAAGAETVKVAPPEMYTHVRWLLKDPVAPGAAGVFEFKARVR